MGYSVHSIEGLIPPLRVVDERLLEIPAGTELLVAETSQYNRVMFFLEADHYLKMEGFPVMHIKRGDIVIQPSDTSQRYRARATSGASSVHVVRILFNLPLLGSRRSPGTSPPEAPEADVSLASFISRHFDRFYHLPRPLSPRLIEFSSALRQEAEERLPGYQLRVNALCIDMIVSTVREMSRGGHAASSFEPSKNVILVQRVKEYLLENFQRPMTLESIAWNMRLSREHLARIFRATTGQTVFEYLIFLRLEKAKGMLYDSSLRVHEVAHACGFSSATLFGRTFRRVVGISPSEYRQQLTVDTTFSPSLRRWEEY